MVITIIMVMIYVYLRLCVSVYLFFCSNSHTAHILLHFVFPIDSGIAHIVVYIFD